MHFPCLHLLQQVLRAVEPVDDRDLHLAPVQVHFCLLDAVHASDAGEADLLQVFRAAAVYKTSQDCLCHSSGHSEDRACAGRQSERHIQRLRLYLRQVDARLLDHAGDLSRREHIVYILLAIRIMLRPCDLCLLRCTRHDGDHHRLLRLFSLCPVLLRVHPRLFFQESAEHLLG